LFNLTSKLVCAKDMKQRKNYKSRFPVGAGNDVGKVDVFSYPFKFFRINQQDCPPMQAKWDLPLLMLALGRH